VGPHRAGRVCANVPRGPAQSVIVRPLLWLAAHRLLAVRHKHTEAGISRGAQAQSRECTPAPLRLTGLGYQPRLKALRLVEAFRMRLTHWLMGTVLGAIVGGSGLALGVFGLLVAVPCLVWAYGEQARPLGLAGLLIGAAAGGGGLFALADARCSSVRSAGEAVLQSCSAPDATPYLVLAFALIGVGATLTIFGLRRTSRAAG
jgi:hypothetical protein